MHFDIESPDYADPWKLRPALAKYDTTDVSGYGTFEFSELKFCLYRRKIIY
jgi:hypothetical protein